MSAAPSSTTSASARAKPRALRKSSRWCTRTRRPKLHSSNLPRPRIEKGGYTAALFYCARRAVRAVVFVVLGTCGAAHAQTVEDPTAARAMLNAGATELALTRIEALQPKDFSAP